MILILDLCYRKNSLSRDEFVTPIANIVRRMGASFSIRHFTEVQKEDLDGAERIVLCGTALKDNSFTASPEEFIWIRDADRPILGICAGMQILSRIFGGGIEQGCEIGMSGIRRVMEDELFIGKEVFEAYELHSYAVRPPERFQVLAVSDACIQAIRHPVLPIYGVMFHPEVRNEWVVERFLKVPLRFPEATGAGQGV